MAKSARDYAKELRTTGCVQQKTRIEAYVLGATIEAELEKSTSGDTLVVYPFQYDLLLSRAHARIFNLAKRIRDSKPNMCGDAEIADVLQETGLDFDGDQIEGQR